VALKDAVVVALKLSVIVCYELALTVDRQAPLDPQRYTGETLTGVSLVELISDSEGVFNASLVCTGRGWV